MRLYIRLSREKETIPFNYQHLLTSIIHKWIGKDNKVHGEVSLYSFSWLQNVNTNLTGVSLTNNSYFFISAYEDSFIKKILKGIIDNPNVCCGSKAYDVEIMETPSFEQKERFLLGSPIFIKGRLNEREQHIIYSDESSGKYLTETMHKKLSLAGLANEGLTIKFDKDYINPHTKLIDYKGIKNRANICPVVIEGTPEQIGFAWNVGIGNSTGIGFGALK